ncbi:MAG: glycosyltransferase family 9 protein [Candidatus Auribacterota bacterium]|nr:glycosyltransferase family 9 protein [Candidatus Auribacterota bacterium]
MGISKIIHQDCRYYRGDRPCRFHKKEGIKCEDCPYYSPFSRKILIIKLDAAGDVLRTTSILSGLKERYPESYLTWITRRASLPLFINNDYVDRVLPLEPEGLLCSQVETFDLSINLDTSPVSSTIHYLVNSEKKIGFTLDSRGMVDICNSEAEKWLRMSIFDDEKKANQESSQAIMAEIVGNPLPPGEIVLNLGPEEIAAADSFARTAGLDRSRLTIGFNTGGGRRWKHKKWTRENTLALAQRCAEELDAQLLLYGGPEEEERNAWLVEKGGGVFIDTGCNNDLRIFFARLNLCDLLVTSDTLALHAAVGLKKKVVALFGPTSAPEIELYGRGEKVVSPVPCQCCYLPDCDVSPDCMESITPDMVFESINRLIII